MLSTGPTLSSWYMSTLMIEVCPWYIASVLLFILSLLICLQYNLLFLWDNGFVTLQQIQCNTGTKPMSHRFCEYSLDSIRKTGCVLMSESHTPNQACLRTLSNVELGAAPLVQHYSLYTDYNTLFTKIHKLNWSQWSFQLSLLFKNLIL